MKNKESTMLTVKETAARIGAGESSVRLWASQGRFAGARQEETPFGSYWLIPEDTLEGFVNPGRGRPSKVKQQERKSKSKG